MNKFILVPVLALFISGLSGAFHRPTTSVWPGAQSVGLANPFSPAMAHAQESSDDSYEADDSEEMSDEMVDQTENEISEDVSLDLLGTTSEEFLAVENESGTTAEALDTLEEYLTPSQSGMQLMPLLPQIPNTGVPENAISTTTPVAEIGFAAVASTSLEDDFSDPEDTTATEILDDAETELDSQTSTTEGAIADSSGDPLGTQTEAPATESTETPTQTEVPDTVTNRNIFETGAVTFRFDDGWTSQYEYALPVLDEAGFKGTFYVVTRQTLNDNFRGFMSRADIQKLASEGHEVGAHTQTHGHLPQMSGAQQAQEIFGAKEDLASLGITAASFSYPYGELTDESVQIVKDAGYTSAVTTEEIFATPSSDKYLIPSPSIRVHQSVAEIEDLIDHAIENRAWLMLSFHRVDYSGDEYSVTPETFAAIVQYVKDREVPVVTVSEGTASLDN